MPPLPRFNHYVPKFILDNFANNGQLSVFDKHTLKKFRLPPYRAMGENDFTNVKVGDATLSFENRFAYIESRAAPIIAEIIAKRSLTFLTPMDQATLHTFVVIQFLRSKRRRLDFTQIGQEIRRRWPDAELNPLAGKVADEEYEKFIALDSTFLQLDEITKALISKHQYLIIKRCDGELYISDNPVVMHNSKEFGPYGNIGLAVPFIEIYYPLSHDVILAYMCKQTMDETLLAHEKLENELNARFGQAFLSKSGLSIAGRIEIESHRKELQRAKAYLSMIVEQRAVPMDSSVLLFLNSLQVASSFRYIACRKNNFDFAIKALSERPHWKEGLGLQIS